MFIKIKGSLSVLFSIFLLALIIEGCGATLPANVRPQPSQNNIAFQARATASAVYTNVMGLYFSPSAAVDGITFESHNPETFWLLPDRQTGFISISLPKPAKVDEIRILNTHNSGYYDRGTKDFHVTAVDVDGIEKEIWRDRFLSKGEFRKKQVGGLIVKEVIIHVDSYYGFGGGLTEVEVIGDLAEPPVKASNIQIQTARHSADYNKAKPYQFNEQHNNWAVVIGISKYKYSGQGGLNNLIFADDDAKVFARTLYNLGWNESHIRLLVNEEATKRNIEIALESWLTKAGSNDQVILFWAGHGYPDPENPERVYFACHDTDISIPATGYRMDKVRTALDEIKSKNVVILADTCHAGKLITRGERGISIVPQIDKMAREQKVPKGWVFMVGADTDRQAIEHTSWTNGAFTHSLIKGLTGAADGFQSAGVKDGVVTMGELKDYMNISMPDETQRVLGVAKRPVITTSTGDPDIWNLTLHVAK
jgi:hypothetical protein